MFNVAYRRVMNTDLPEPVRFLAFLWCLESYCSLTAQKFEHSYMRIGRHIGFDWLQKPNKDQLVEAANLLKSEREHFLNKMAVFKQVRREEKMKGQRQPRRDQTEQLYFPNWLKTNNEIIR